MRMGNYFSGRALLRGVMATTTRPAVGLWHVTVVPENFEPGERPRSEREIAATDDETR
jgi:hypothetical protein